MSDQKKSSRKLGSVTLGSRLWFCALGASLVALVVYALTLAGYVFPGESAHLFTQWMGMDSLPAPVHPVWGGLVKLVGGTTFTASLAVRLNLISLVCGVLSAGLVCLLVGFFVLGNISHEDSLPRAQGASSLAGLVSALVFVFSTAVWQSSTHLDFNLFAVFLVLAVFALFIPMAKWPRLTVPFSALAGVGVAVGLAESPIFITLLPVFLMAVVVTAVRNDRKFYLPAVLFLAVAAIGYLVVARSVASSYLQLPCAATGGFEDAGAVLVKVLQENVHELRQWISRAGWLYVIILAVLPFVACAFAAPRGLNSERSWSQYLFHVAMTVCAVLATATPLSPEAVMRPFGISPVATTTLVAVVCGYLAAYWYLLARAPLPAVEYDKNPVVLTVGKKVAPVAMAVFLGVVALGSLVNAFGCARDRGAFADICANEVIERMGARTWLVTDGLLDDHLRVVAASRGKELNLVCLHRDTDDAYLKELAALVKARKLEAGKANLAVSIQLGVLPFLQDWFMGDDAVTEKAAVFSVPDLWFMAERQPVPECLFFGGVKDCRKEVDGAKALAAFKAFWEKIEPVLPIEKGKGSRIVDSASDPLDAFRIQLRRQVGFVGNNLGVVLQDLGMDKEAFALYELVLKTIDCDNISALFNEFEMARAGVKEAAVHRTEIERQLKAIVDDPKRRYVLWSLARYFGYIRSPEIFARMGWGWALSGQAGNAIAQAKRAQNLVPSDRQAGLLNMMAAFYASGNKAEKSREIYQQVLAQDAANHDALMGLARLAMKEGAIDEARSCLEKATKSAKGAEASGMDWALLHLMNNDFKAARLALQKLTDVQPKSQQAWSLLAGTLIQQFDLSKDEKERRKLLEELEGVILPKMEAISASPRDYFVQMTRALVLMRKGKDFRKAARDALITASAARPDVGVVGDMVLNLDVEMNDRENAEKHARQVLRLDRSNKLANYVMGSLRLGEGDYKMAETFLRLSVQATKPLPAAQNDLAECLRRLQRSDEAEQFARAAVTQQPDLYVAWETLGSALLDQKKNLEEAETCVAKAIKLAKDELKVEDPRMQITLARVQIAKGDLGRARGTLRQIRANQKNLSKYDLGEVEKLQQEAKGKSR